jgi:DNA-binding CsgD family transcriptional regulator
LSSAVGTAQFYTGGRWATLLPVQLPEQRVVRRNGPSYHRQMERLSERDVQLALGVVVAAGGSQSGAPFSLDTVDALAEAIPADEAQYIESRFGPAEYLSVGRGEDDPAINEAAMAACWSFPLRDPDHADSPTPLKISDLVSSKAWRNTASYAAVFRPLGLEHEIKLFLTAPAGHARYFSLMRAPGRDFDERDRALLSLLRPHLVSLRSRWAQRPRLALLTDRELEVMELVGEGVTNRQIAQALFISPATVRTHLEHVYEKLGVRTRTAAVAALRRAS